MLSTEGRHGKLIDVREVGCTDAANSCNLHHVHVDNMLSVLLDVHWFMSEGINAERR